MISLKDLVHISLRQVFRQRKRSLSIILAIALGTAGLIAVMGVGDEVKRKLNRDLDLLGGATLLKVSFRDEQFPGTRPQYFKDAALDEIRSLSGVHIVSRASERLLVGYHFSNERWHNLKVLGVDEYYWSANNLTTSEGRFFDANEVRNNAQVCVLGRGIANSLFGEGKALGSFLPINKGLYRVVGIVDGLLIGPRKDFVFIPYMTLLAMEGDLYRPDRLSVQCKTWDDVGPVVNMLPEIVGKFQDDTYLTIEAGWAQLKRIIAIVWWVELFVYLAIGATLTLGGFGIWSGMMTSVTARTREIGLKKAMGAGSFDIMGQFLLESFSLSLIAAVAGTGLGFLVVEVISGYLGSRADWQTLAMYALTSIVFSGLLGLVAGFYPALRASRMDVVTAIRYE